MDIFPKFIIEDGNLIISKCTYHYQLATNKNNVKGGGWYEFDFNEKVFTFYGESSDFGIADIEDIKKAINSDRVYTNPMKIYSIAKKYKFRYKFNDDKIIELNEKNN